MMPTALIVEDEPEANRLLSMLVRLRGYDTESAFTGGEALAKVDEAPPDIIFLDLMLPDINGYDVCRSLKTSKSTALIPVVMVTARTTLENRLQSYEFGADNYVPKPYTPDQIFDAMAEADLWSRHAVHPVVEGRFTLGPGDDGEPARQIARVRNLLLAGTGLDARAVEGVGDALRGMAASAEEFGRKRSVSDVAALAYATRSDRLTLAISDHANWFGDDPRPAERWADLLSRAHFDELGYDPSRRTLTLAKVLPYAESHPHAAS